MTRPVHSSAPNSAPAQCPDRFRRRSGQPLPESVVSDLASVVAGNVKRLRVLSGRSQTWLGQQIGCDQTVISEIEWGQLDVGVARLAAIAAAFSVSPADLLTEPGCCPTCHQVLPVKADPWPAFVQPYQKPEATP